MRAYPGTSFDWWVEQIENDDQLVATAIDLLPDDDDEEDDHGDESSRTGHWGDD